MNRNDVITALTGRLDCTRSLKSPIVHISIPTAETILELLKEQEPVSPIRMHHTEHKQTDNYRCGKCGDDMYFEQRFCEFCGQAAKWD